MEEVNGYQTSGGRDLLIAWSQTSHRREDEKVLWYLIQAMLAVIEKSESAVVNGQRRVDNELFEEEEWPIYVIRKT